MHKEAISYFKKLLKNPQITPLQARKMTKAVYPDCPISCLLEEQRKLNIYGKIIMRNPRLKKMPKALQAKLSKKIRLLMREGYPQKQAIAIAYSMVAPKYVKKSNPRKLDDYTKVGKCLAELGEKIIGTEFYFINLSALKEEDILCFEFQYNFSEKKLTHLVSAMLVYLENHTIIDEEDDKTTWNYHIDNAPEGMGDGFLRICFALKNW